MKKMYLIVVLLTASGLAALIAMTPMIWFDLPSLVIVLVFPIVLSLGSHSPVEIISYFQAGFSKKISNRSTVKKGINFFRGLRRYLYVSAFWGVLGGVVSVMSNLGGDLKHLGMGAALSVITLFYGITIDLLFVSPFEKGMEKKLLDIESDQVDSV